MDHRESREGSFNYLTDEDSEVSHMAFKWVRNA